MNEKIKELAKQASADLDPEGFMGASEEFLELFAGLIVGECASIAVAGTASAVSDAIREAFGVSYESK